MIMSDVVAEADQHVVTRRPEQNLALLSGVTIRLSVEVGSAAMRLSDLLDLSEGSVVELDRQADDLLDVLANGTLIARGEIVTVEGRYAVRVVDVVTPDKLAVGTDRRQ